MIKKSTILLGTLGILYGSGDATAMKTPADPALENRTGEWRIHFQEVPEGAPAQVSQDIADTRGEIEAMAKDDNNKGESRGAEFAAFRGEV